MKDTSIRTYLLWAFGLAWPLQGLASWLALRGSSTGFTLVLAVSMFAPLAAALLAKAPFRSFGWKPRLRGRLRWVLAAWFMPAILASLGAALYYRLVPASFDGTGASYLATLPAEAQAQLRAQGVPFGVLLLGSVFAAVGYAPWINMIPSLGEEIGWRGFLYPRLKERFGRVRGLLLGGAIWGAWHWPVMILAGYEYGKVYWGAPLSGMLLFCVVTAALGVLLDFVYEKTGCIWAPALGHGAFNAFAAIPSMLLVPAYADRLLVGPLAIGVVGGLPMFLLAALLLGRKEENA